MSQLEGMPLFTATTWIVELLCDCPTDAPAVQAVDAWARDEAEPGFVAEADGLGGLRLLPTDAYLRLVVDLLCTAAVGHAREAA